MNEHSDALDLTAFGGIERRVHPSRNVQQCEGQKQDPQWLQRRTGREGTPIVALDFSALPIGAPGEEDGASSLSHHDGVLPAAEAKKCLTRRATNSVDPQFAHFVARGPSHLYALAPSARRAG